MTPLSRLRPQPDARLHFLRGFLKEPQKVGSIIPSSRFMEKRIVKVLKGLAEYHDMSLGDLLEGVVLHAFDGKSPFPQKTLKKIKEIKKVYDLDLDSSHSHKLMEE